MNSIMLCRKSGREGGREGEGTISLPEIEMKHPNSGLGDTISHVNQAKHRAAMFVSFYIDRTLEH